MYEDWSVGENPPNGASINYWLGDGEGREVQVRVENSDGETLATLDGSSHDGFNRVWWNFRGPDANPIHYRTKPQFADWMPMPEVSRQVGGGFFGFGGGPRQPPGTYTVTLVVDGEDVGSEELTVLRDPSSEGSMADILAQKALLDDIVEDRNRLADAVNQIELLRRQIYDLRPVLEEAGTRRTCSRRERRSTSRSSRWRANSCSSRTRGRTECAGPR